MRRAAILFAVDDDRPAPARRVGPVADAVALARALRSPRGGAWEDEQLLVRLDARATSGELFRILKILTRTRWDQVLLSLHGHGGHRGLALRDRAVTWAEIGILLRGVRARHKLVVADVRTGGRGLYAGVEALEAFAASLVVERCIADLTAACPDLGVLADADPDPTAPSLTRYLLGAMEVCSADLPGEAVSAARLFTLAQGALERDRGPYAAIPEAAGDLDACPFAVSDLAEPFGRVAVACRPAWTSGAVRHVPLLVEIVDRRFLPTCVRAWIDTPDGPRLLAERNLLPDAFAHAEAVTVSFDARLGGAVYVEVAEPSGRPVGPVVAVRVPRPAWERARAY